MDNIYFSELSMAKKEKNQDKQLLASLDIQLRSVKADRTQATYDKQTLQAEITYNKNVLKNAVIRSPIKGTIRSIEENGTPYTVVGVDVANKTFELIL